MPIHLHNCQKQQQATSTAWIMATKVWLMLLISIACVSINAASDRDYDMLPRSVGELKQYYDVIGNLEKRGLLSPTAAGEEKRLYIEQASKIAGRKELLTEEEFLTWKQRQIIVSFSNLIAIVAGVIVMGALTVLIGVFLVPWLARVPVIFWEILSYMVSVYCMIFISHPWLIFLGCLAFVAIFSYSAHSRVSNQKHLGFIMSWTCFAVWTIVAIYQQHPAAGYLAVMALESALGFVVFFGELTMVIGFQHEKVVPCATIASLVMLLLGSVLHRQQQTNPLTAPLTRPLLFMGTFVYFIGMLILTSGVYAKGNMKKHVFWFLQICAFVSGLATMFFGPMLNIPFIQAIGGTMFVIWLLEKYVETAPWTGTLPVTGSLLGFGLLLYGFAFFLQRNPEYFIFHTYSSK